MKLMLYVRKLSEMVRRAPLEGELDDELHFHLAMEEEKYIARGMSRADAHREALRVFGGHDRFAEETRDARRLPWLEETLRDARHGLRQLGRTPSFTAVAIITLALTIGANTTIFSVVNGVLLAKPPYPSPDRVVVAWETDRNSGTEREPASWPDYLDFAARARMLSDLEAVSGGDINLTPPSGEPVRLSGMRVTHGYFDQMGIYPVLGRVFGEDEDREGRGNVAVISESFWRSTLGGDRSIIGRSVRLDDVEYTVVGVVPDASDFGLDQVHARADYHGGYSGAGTVDVWVPLQATEASFPRDTHPILLIGRLSPDASVASAQKELSSIAAELERTFQVNAGRGVHVESLDDVVFAPVRPALALLSGAVVLVLLIGCVNVAGLLLARGSTRAREVAVRTALGAGGVRLARQFAAETIVLALLGGAAGVALAYGGLQLVLAMAPADIPRLDHVRIDTSVLLATLLISVLVGVVFGLVPTAQALRSDVNDALREGRSTTGSRRTNVRALLVVAELAMAVMLMIGGTLLVRSFRSVLAIDPGFQTAGVLKAEYQLPETRYPRDFQRWPDFAEIHRFNRMLAERAAAIPGVSAVALAGNHPLDPGFTNSFNIPGREAEADGWPEISVRSVSAGYFDALALPIERGRALRPGDDTRAATVAVINRAAADLLFPGREAIGQVIQFWGADRLIVGVAGNEKLHGLTEATPPAVYVPITQVPTSAVLLVRTDGDPSALADAVRAAIWSVDPALAIHGVEPLRATVAASVAQRRFTMLVVTAFGVLATLLALIGVHGMMSYTTSQRTREFGIRLALGATRGEVERGVVAGGLKMGVAGAGLGILGGLASARWITSLLYGVTAGDVATYAGVTAAALAAAALASWIPAHRASSAQALDALRAE